MKKQVIKQQISHYFTYLIHIWLPGFTGFESLLQALEKWGE